MRNHVILFLNGTRHDLSGEHAFLTLSDFLRYERGLTGTKVVCAEGDCGACTVVVARMDGERLGAYKSINSCIAFLWQLDRTHVISVEGLKRQGALHPVQESMMNCHGAQCGYCTPGFICSMAVMAHEAHKDQKTLSDKNVRNALTGNLCRCTGYQAIIDAGVRTPITAACDLSTIFDDDKISATLASITGSLAIEANGKRAFLPHSMAELLQEPTAKIVSGSTDLGVLHNKGKWTPTVVKSFVAVEELKQITETPEGFLIGAAATLHHVAETLEKDFPEFARLLNVFASPQIKNSATLVGNMLNASPIADTIPFLKVAHARVHLLGATGTRELDVNDFYRPGYKQLDLAPGEVVTHVFIPKTSDAFKLYKVSRRKDLDISAVTLALRYQLQDKKLTSFKLAMGGVAASVLRFPSIEARALGQNLDESLMRSIAQEIDREITPVSDVRGSAEYRRLLSKNLLLKFAHEVRV